MPKIAFAKIPCPRTEELLGQEGSVNVWGALQEKGYLDKEGAILEKFDPSRSHFELNIGEEYADSTPSYH